MHPIEKCKYAQRVKSILNPSKQTDRQKDKQIKGNKEKSFILLNLLYKDLPLKTKQKNETVLFGFYSFWRIKKFPCNSEQVLMVQLKPSSAVTSK